MIDVEHTYAHLRDACARLASRDGEIVEDQIAITEIAAPTGEERERAEWVAQRFGELGLAAIDIDAAGNVMGTRRGSTGEPPVVVLAHLDTVFPRDAIKGARREQDRVYAPGIGDNGRGLATMLALAGAIDGERVTPRRPVCFVGTTGEEGTGDLRGAKHFFASHGDVAAAIALDGTGDDRIVHRAVGSRRLRVTFDGPGGHSWSDFGVVNPVHAAATVIARLGALTLPSKPRTTLTVSRTGGGLSVNAIPQRAWFEVDIRSTSPEPVQQLETVARGLVETVRLEMNPSQQSGKGTLHVTVELIGDRPCGELAPTAPLVQTAIAATTIVGVTPELATASTDANVPLSLGIPAITIGGGGTGGNVHTVDEWYENTDGARGLARALLIVTATAGLK